MKEKRSQKRWVRSEEEAGSDERRGAGLEKVGDKLTCRRGRVRSDGERDGGEDAESGSEEVVVGGCSSDG